MVSCGRGEDRVERRQGRLVADSDVQYAAFGQLEAGACPKFVALPHRGQP